MTKEDYQRMLLDDKGDDLGRRTCIKELLEDKIDSYLERDRGYGQGNVRIGNHVELDEDIYSLGFAS